MFSDSATCAPTLFLLRYLNESRQHLPNNLPLENRCYASQSALQGMYATNARILESVSVGVDMKFQFSSFTSASLKRSATSALSIV